MEVEIIKSARTSQKNIVYVRVSKDEALMLVKSLCSQMLDGNPNSGRLEQHAADGTYFTIVVSK